MTTSKGPWSYDEESGLVLTKDMAGVWLGSVTGDSSAIVCQVESHDGVSNGHLLAAAPEIRDALRSLLDWLMDDYRAESDAVAIYDTARAALAKAER